MKKIYVLLLAGLFLVPFSAVSQDNNTEPKANTNGNIIDTRAIIKDLREKEKNLNIREADLNAKEARLNAMEQDLLARENDIKKIREEVSQELKKLGEKKDKELENLVKVYSTAKPKAAANIIMAMDMNTAIAIFNKMTPNVAGKIINEIGKSNPAFASKMAETLTYQPKFGKDK